MIDSLHGEVLSIGLDHAVIGCGGVGYRFLATPLTLGRLARGEHADVVTALVVRDDGMTLFGFADEDSRTMFHKLQTVSGLGPKLAMASLAVFQAGELAELIASGDAKKIQTIPGVGKKMAERIVLELKDKVVGLFEMGGESNQGSSAPISTTSGVSEQIVEALIGLGFTERGVRSVVESLVADQPDTDPSSLLRAALRTLSKK